MRQKSLNPKGLEPFIRSADGILITSFLAVGSGLAVLTLALLTVVGWNYREASRLESATARLAQTKTQTVIDAALIGAISALPTGLKTLNKQQRDSLYPPMDAYAKLDRLTEDIKAIRNGISDAVVAGVICSITAFLSGLLYDMGNTLYVPTAIVCGVSLILYLFGGVFQIRKITMLERINERISSSSSVDDLRNAAVEALEKLG
jgi:hypothetical protein